ncbi:MAG: ACT domain-containing protein, partial [Gemmiger sp.]
VIEFAYAIHSAVGNRMIGAKVNNRIVPIDHQVVTGEIVEILTGPENRGPSRDWLGIVKTSEAKAKIRNWFKKERREENIEQGRAAFEHELRRNLMSIPADQYDEFMANLARRNRCNSVDEMFAAIGYGGLQMARVLPKLKEEYQKLKAEEPKPVTVDIKRIHSSDGVVVEGIDNCPIKFAKCCSPLPGDEIIGFVTRGFGVSIHKKDCQNARESMRHPENADRWIRAYWDDAARENYKATVDLVCMDRDNLVSDIALALGDMRVPIYSLTARAADHGRARMSVTVGITNTEHLNSVVAKLKKVRDVISVTRN